MRAKSSNLRVRSKKSVTARQQNKPKRQFFSMQEPHQRDKLIGERAEILSSEVDLRYKQGLKTKKPKYVKSKKSKEAEIISKETKKTSPVNKKNKKKK